MTFDFSGKKIIVCGGSRGIGRSTALGFAAAGASVSICARGADTLESTRRELAAHGQAAHAGICDLGDETAIKRYVADAAAALGGIDVLVNNASGFGMTDDTAGWTAGFAVDVMAIVHASHAALPFLEKADAGCIVSVSSISSMRPSMRSVPYGAVKAAVNHYTATQAALLGAQGIRVNAVAPGSIEFPGGTWEKRRQEGSPIYAKVRDSIPTKRLGTPEEVANVILFLASPLAAWVTGQTIVVDGGQLLFS
jgi:3-oxoacyl-[acyl-carrier protein] reductase